MTTKLTELNSLLATSYDPVTAELIQMRLGSIVEEMATTLIRTSGSPVLTEAKDFSTAIFDDKKEHVAFAGYVTTHLGSSLVGVKSIADYYDETMIKPRDHFILNDPHTAGALHQGDVAIISPLFYNDKLIGWAFSNAHVLDVGGMSPGGWAPEARDLYSEALRFVPTKIVSEGKLNFELFNLIRNNVRLPEPVVNDIKSLIAANNVCQRRILDTIEKFGLDDYKKYCEINKQLSEEMLILRIGKIQNGSYLAEDWVEYDGHGIDQIFRISCKVTIEDESITVDYTGSDPQADAFINAGEGIMVGIVASELMINLAYDIPINAGILRALNIHLGPSGTIVNPTVPAPVSCGHMEAGSKSGRVVREALTRAMQFSQDMEIRKRTAALGVYSWPGNSWVGKDQSGNYTAFAVLDCGSGGMGAQSNVDGLDISSYEVNLDNSIPDVEINEGLYPMLYLWRSINQNSGGPGFYRGGQGIDLAWTPYETDSLNGTLENACAQVPSRGVLGGYPASTNAYKIYKDTNVFSLLKQNGKMPSESDLKVEAFRLPNHTAHMQLSGMDVFRLQTGGGGGLGDPLYRDMTLVEKDVKDGYISMTMANKAYGVVIDDQGNVDKLATIQLRTELLQQRIGHEQVNLVAQPEDVSKLGLMLQEGNQITCACCRYTLCDSSQKWREFMVRKEFDLADRLKEMGIEIQKRQDPRLFLVESYCPTCATLIDTSITDENSVELGEVLMI